MIATYFSKLIEVLNFVVKFFVFLFLQVVAKDQRANVVVNDQAAGVNDVTEEVVELFLEVHLHFSLEGRPKTYL